MVAGLAALVVAIGVAMGAALRADSGPGGTGATVLLAGDSVLAAAGAAAHEQTPRGVRTVVAAGVGFSPCDLWLGGRDGIGPEGVRSFRRQLEISRPAAVVLAFTGNPGLTGTGCVDARTDYGLTALLDAYRRALDAMGRAAAGAGARVFLAAVPPRNPSVPEGWDGSVQHNFNGDPAFDRVLKSLAQDRHWTYDDGAARALSGPGGSWSEYLPCTPADGAACSDGRVQVRTGAGDAIHCAVPGTRVISPGSLRYAFGLLENPLRWLGYRAVGLNTSAVCR